MGSPERLRVAVLFGGRSSEHSISCVSAAGVLRALDPARYDVRALAILPDGRWVEMDPDAALLDAPAGSLPTAPDTGRPVALVPEPLLLPSLVPPTRGAGGPRGEGTPELIADIDVVFPVLHGPWGEDGTIQGVLEMAGIPYVGSGVFASAAAMDKGHMKALLSAAGLPVGPSIVVTPLQWQRDPAAMRERIGALGFPVFVKPARAGSSVGISRVTGPDGLDAAIAEARRWDPRLIVEAAIVGAREIECGVLVGPDGVPQASACAEIKVGSGHDFYDFAAKYLDDAAELIVPADMADEVADRVRALACEAFMALDCEGLARVDFFVADPGAGDEPGIWINEVNTMPGFTPISMYPRMWQVSGLTYSELVDRLIADALRKGTGLR